jgi:hypothetical protein
VKQGTEVEENSHAAQKLYRRTSKAANQRRQSPVPGGGVVFMHWVTDSPPFSTFRTIFIEPDANLNYDYPEWLFTSSHSLPYPLLCRG